MVKIIKNIFLLILLFAFLVLGQTSDKINEQNEQLKNIKDEIARLEKELGSKKEQKEESLKILEKINEQSLLLNKLINKIKKEETQKEVQINKLSDKIKDVNKKISELKDIYARYVVWLYKNGKASYLEFLFNSHSVNQALVRYKYLNSITDKNREVLSNLSSLKTQLSSLSQDLSKEVSEKERLVKEKQVEQDRLAKRKKERLNLVENLKQDQSTLEKAIRIKQQAEIQIKNLVAKLIEEERQRQAKLREAKLKNEKSFGVVDYNYNSFENFAELKGKLNWPITKGSIFRNFGENVNEKLKTVTLNYGIDIKTDAKTEVLAVAEGIVSAIDWIPGYGSVVIITHRDNFRTVYGHITDIFVDEGEKVKGGTRIGKVSDSFEGRIMHFEIWNERNYQNPEKWLHKRK
jgi:murein hydrolase activator